MTKDKFEVIETKLAELYQLQWARLERLAASREPSSNVIREEISEAREILTEWLWCLEAKERVHRRFEAKANLD